MKLSKQSVDHLKILLQTMAIPKIDRIVIEDGCVRGIDEDQTVVIISDQNIPDFGGFTVGLHRLSTLSSRINLLEAAGDLSVEAVEKNKDIEKFNISAKGTKFEFKCARADMIKAPKKVNEDFIWEVLVSPEAIKLSISATNTMDSEQIALCSKASGEVSFEVVDSVTKDTFSTVIATDAKWLADEDDRQSQSFVHYYTVKTIVPLLKAASVVGPAKLVVGQEGMLKITLNGHEFILIPRDNDQ